MLDDDIDAAIVSEAADFLRNGHDEVVDDFVGAEFASLDKFFVGAGRCDDARTEKLGDLDGGAADTASGSENQDGFARLELSAADEHVPGGEEDERNSGGLRPVEILRIRETVDLGHTNIFSATAVDHVTEIGEIATVVILTSDAGGTFAAGNARSENDFLPDMNGRDFWADIGDFAGDIAAGNVGERDSNTGEAAANPEVEMIEGAGADANQDFIVAEGRFGDISIAKNRRVTVFMDDDGFHQQPPGSVGDERRQRHTYRIYRITICWVIARAVFGGLLENNYSAFAVEKNGGTDP